MQPPVAEEVQGWRMGRPIKCASKDRAWLHMTRPTKDARNAENCRRRLRGATRPSALFGLHQEQVSRHLRSMRLVCSTLRPKNPSRLSDSGMTNSGDGLASHSKICSTWQTPQRDSKRLPIMHLARGSLEYRTFRTKGGRAMCSHTRIRFLSSAAICGFLFACLSTAAVAESLEPSSDKPSASVESTLADLKSRIEQLENRVGRQSTFQGRGAVARPTKDVTN
jgi:hypothetical protein